MKTMGLSNTPQNLVDILVRLSRKLDASEASSSGGAQRIHSAGGEMASSHLPYKKWS